MPSAKPLFPSIFLIITLLLLIFASYNHRTSLSYRFQTLLSNPQTLPSSLVEIFPESGSTISIKELARLYPGGPCFYLNTAQDLGFDDIELEINEIDYVMWMNNSPVMSVTDDWQYCFYYLKLMSGNYLLDLTIEKLGIDHFQWAFTVTDN